MRLAYGLPAPESRDVAVERDIRITMPDGVVLLADHYYPRDLTDRPTVLSRSVYTDRTKARWQFEMFAAQGFHVLVVSGRGVCGSGGRFTPFTAERDDGAAVLDWLRRREWFNGSLGTTGASYLGYTQWAIAAGAGEALKAISTQFISSDLTRAVYPGGGFALELWMWWLSMVNAQEMPTFLVMLNSATAAGRLRKKAFHLPLVEMDRLVTGTECPFWREWLEHEDPGDPYWDRADHGDTVQEVTAPDHLVGGWYDFMLPGLVRDYERLRDAGRRPYLTIGPWTHFDTRGNSVAAREGVLWLRAHLLGERGRLREKPVRVYVLRRRRWREYDSWPPPGVKNTRWHLQPGGGLSTDGPRDSEPDSWTYDPSDPTPSLGGAARTYRQGKGSVDNRELEARPDVLTFTGEALGADLEITGGVSAKLYASSSPENADFFVRVCDVAPSGKSLNVSDGLRRVRPGSVPRRADGTLEVEVEMLPTAYLFRRGHRIRVQVSGGSFPRWNRNPGTGEPLPVGRRLAASERSLYHDPERPSSVLLPVHP